MNKTKGLATLVLASYCALGVPGLKAQCKYTYNPKERKMLKIVNNEKWVNDRIIKYNNEHALLIQDEYKIISEGKNVDADIITIVLGYIPLIHGAACGRPISRETIDAQIALGGTAFGTKPITVTTVPENEQDDVIGYLRKKELAGSTIVFKGCKDLK